MTAPTMRRDLSPLTSATLEGGNVVLRELDVTGPETVVRTVVLRPEERRALAVFLAEVEAGERVEEEPQCGAIRPEDDAVCVDLEGHQDDGLDHLWVDGVRNLCIYDPMPGRRAPAEAREEGRPVSEQQTTSQVPVDLDEAQRLCDEATREPWGWRGYDDGAIELRAWIRGGTRVITTIRSDPCVAETDDNALVLLQGACASCRRAYDTPDLEAFERCEKAENRGTIWANSEHGVVKPLNKWAVREVPYRADVADVNHPDARFIARSRELLPRLVAEVRKAQPAIWLAEATVALRQAEEANPNDYRDAFSAWRGALSAYLKSKGLGTGEFCEEHFSWLCASGQGKCQRAAEPELRRSKAEQERGDAS